MKKISVLFHMNCFRGADINTGFAIYTHVLIDFRLFVLYCYCRCRALTDTGLTPGAFILVYYSYHDHSLHDYCFRGTDINTGLAVYAQVLVHFSFFIL
jgi:hypothetical protein